MDNTNDFDVVVIGSGPGGYVAAIRAAQLGLKVLVIEREDTLGGVCLNWGCIPTKALLKAAETYSLMLHADKFGITFKNVEFNLAKMVSYSRNVSARLAEGIKHLFKKNNVTVINGHGKIEGKNNITISDNSNRKLKNIKTKYIIIAAGARSKIIPELIPDKDMILSSKEAMIPKRLPKKLLIIGSGAIGIEFASFYNMLEVDVTIVEVNNKILNTEDIEISNLAKQSFEKRGIKIILEAKISNITKDKKFISLTIESKSSNLKYDLKFDTIILAVGIVPNTENLGLENIDIQFDKGFIKTNHFQETNEKNVYAIGDITQAPWLAHKASHEGVLCSEYIAKLENKPKAKDLHIKPIDKSMIPGCIYSYPQIASVGLTEEDAKSKGYDINIGKFPLFANGKAIAMDEMEGLVKTIFDSKTGELLGAHMIGIEVTEMIQGYVIAKMNEITNQELIHTIFPHPTISESMHESVLASLLKAIHI